jgi:hypothetical protein
MARLDPDRSGEIDLDEFLDAMLSYIVAFSTRRVDSERASAAAAASVHPARSSTRSAEEEEEEEIEV